MLLTLSVRDFVVVESLELDFGPGFTVLTGETGAGKSILIDALQLALGERADSGVIREGAPRAEVAAEFRIDPGGALWLANAGLDREGDVALLRRIVDAAGRSRAFINGSPVTLAQLREFGETLVDIHGQHAHQSLLRAAAQLQLLDEHGQLQASARTVASAYAELRRARQARLDAEAAAASAASERERLLWTSEELQELAPEPGEWERVSSEHKRLSHAASLLEGAHEAIDTLAEAELAALARIDAASGRLRPLAGFDARLQPVLSTRRRCAPCAETIWTRWRSRSVRRSWRCGSGCNRRRFFFRAVAPPSSPSPMIAVTRSRSRGGCGAPMCEPARSRSVSSRRHQHARPESMCIGRASVSWPEGSQ